MNYLRNKLGYTSYAMMMRVQWDFKDNCGKRKFRNPVRPVESFRETEPPSFFNLCGWRNKRTHQYIPCDRGMVCSHCGHFKDELVSENAKYDPQILETYLFMKSFAECSGNLPITTAQIGAFVKRNHFQEILNLSRRGWLTTNNGYQKNCLLYAFNFPKLRRSLL